MENSSNIILLDGRYKTDPLGIYGSAERKAVRLAGRHLHRLFSDKEKD